MGLNPFKDADLNDLQENSKKFLSGHFANINKVIKKGWRLFLKKGNERVTLMFIPHSEKRIINFHISIFTISFVTIFLIGIITVTLIFVVDHTSNIKEISSLKEDDCNSKIQRQQFKDGINSVYNIFQHFKPELKYLFSLTPDNSAETLYAKGGADNSNQFAQNSGPLPPLEILNLIEMQTELKETKDILKKLKDFLKKRRKIIENTPSIWPVNGYILAPYGKRISPYSFKEEFRSGIDIGSFPGAEIYATAPGIIENIRWDTALGLTISIKHKYGFITVYSHCQRVSVKMGQEVSKKEVIGYVGKTGKATRHQCHYQIKIGTEYIDPIPYLNKISKKQIDYSK